MWLEPSVQAMGFDEEEEDDDQEGGSSFGEAADWVAI